MEERGHGVKANENSEFFRSRTSDDAAAKFSKRCFFG